MKNIIPQVAFSHRSSSSSQVLRHLTVFILIQLILGCGGGGGGGGTGVSSGNDTATTVAPSNGPGDVDNIFPLTIGNTWNINVTAGENINGSQQTHTYTNILSVIGTQMVNGVTTRVVQEDNADGANTSVNLFYSNLSGGINYYGNNDPTDLITPLVTPYAELMFPLIPGSGFDRFVNLKKTYPEDLDGDGINESLTLNDSVQTTAIENMQTIAGNFVATRRVVDNLELTLQLSNDKSKWTSNTSATTWYAPSVGEIKEIVTQTTNSPNGIAIYTTQAELQGYDVDGVKKGIQAPFSIALPGISGGDEPSVGFDGSRYLLTFFGGQGGQVHLFGMFISLDGTQSSIFSIATFSAGFQISWGAWPSIAFDGVNYLVAYERSDFGRIYGIRVAQDGTVLDQNGGFQISNIVNPEEDMAPVVAFDGTNYLVVWHKRLWSTFYEGVSILGAFVTPAGVASNIFTISSDLNSSRSNPSLAFNGSNYLVAWRDSRNTSAGNAHVYAARVSPQGLILDPEGMPITETSTMKYSIQVRPDEANFRISWWDQDSSNSLNNYYCKHVANDGTLIDQPTTGNGLTVLTRNIARQSSVLIDDASNLDVWTDTSEEGHKSVANSTINSLVVWNWFGVLYGAFVYPLAE